MTHPDNINVVISNKVNFNFIFNPPYNIILQLFIFKTNLKKLSYSLKMIICMIQYKETNVIGDTMANTSKNNSNAKKPQDSKKKVESKPADTKKKKK